MADLHLDLLDRVQVAAPCPMRWEDMDGDAIQRHCDKCDLHVTNLSAMTRAQAATWVAQHSAQGRNCVAFYRRADGTILTRDCPVGLAALRQRVYRRASRIAAALAFLLTGGLLLARSSDRQRTLADLEPMKSLRQWLRPTPPSPPPPVQRGILVGACGWTIDPEGLLEDWVAELLAEDSAAAPQTSSVKHTLPAELGQGA